MRGMVGPACEVRFLGLFECRVDGVSIERWHAGRARSLFQYLLLNRGHLVTQARLYEVLWPESEGARSSSLKVAVHALRKILRDQGVPESRARVEFRDGGYLLHAPDAWIDVDAFDEAIERGRRADLDRDAEAAVAAYRRAMDLYTGDFLAAEDAPWADEQRQWCRSSALRALERLVQEAVEGADDAAIVSWCRRIVAIDPYCETAYQALIASHGRFGELASVRSWHRICERRLLGDLGIAPAEETRKLFSLAMNGKLRIDSGMHLGRSLVTAAG